MQHGAILNEKLMPFPNGSFPDSHMETPLETGPSPSTWQKLIPAVRGVWAQGPGGTGMQQEEETHPAPPGASEQLG